MPRAWSDRPAKRHHAGADHIPVAVETDLIVAGEIIRPIMHDEPDWAPLSKMCEVVRRHRGRRA